jgi:activator of HSP90 ATPase
MNVSFEIREIVDVNASLIFNAWLNSEMHSEMTGGLAVCSNEINGEFSAWDGYITGRNVDLFPNKKIVQQWRTTEFNHSDEDSILTINLVEHENSTEIIFLHSSLPEGQTHYEQGWKEHYFELIFQTP